MKQLLLVGAGLAAAYLVFGNKGTNNPLPTPPAQPAPTAAPVTVLTFNPAIQPKGLTIPSATHTVSGIGARAYGNCQCKDGSLCVGHGNCACCDGKGGAVMTHTLILPMVKTLAPAARVTGNYSASVLG